MESARVPAAHAAATGVARALINGPAVILADELTGSLDRSADEQVADGQWELGRGPLTRARS